MEETKICTKCRERKLFNDFIKNKRYKDGLASHCKKCHAKTNKVYSEKNKKKNIGRTEYAKTKKCGSCKKEKDSIEFNKNSVSKDGLSSFCKECHFESNRKYRENNKKKNLNTKLVVKTKKCHKCEKEKSAGEFYLKTLGHDGLNENCISCCREYYEENKEIILLANATKNASFLIYSDRLTIEEEPISDKNGDLMCRCTYCKEYFYPTRSQVKLRIGSLNGKRGGGECRLYCSDLCKSECDIFGSKTTPKSLRDDNPIRCNQKRVRKILIELQLNEFGHSFCEKCGNEFPPEELFFHHNIPIADDPNEYDNASHYMLVCKEHHTHEGCLNF